MNNMYSLCSSCSLFLFGSGGFRSIFVSYNTSYPMPFQQHGDFIQIQAVHVSPFLPNTEYTEMQCCTLAFL